MCGANWHTGLPIQRKVILFGFPGHGFYVYVLTYGGWCHVYDHLAIQPTL